MEQFLLTIDIYRQIQISDFVKRDDVKAPYTLSFASYDLGGAVLPAL